MRVFEALSALKFRDVAGFVASEKVWITTDFTRFGLAETKTICRSRARLAPVAAGFVGIVGDTLISTPMSSWLTRALAGGRVAERICPALRVELTREAPTGVLVAGLWKANGGIDAAITGVRR